jgi:FeS assembly SUF system regulator
MLRMSKLADYSFILLAQMVSENKPSWAASELADRTTLPAPTVAKLMKVLAKAGIVTGQRGATGGYRLAAPAKEISVARIVEAVDGPIALTDCVVEGETHDCAVKSMCPMHGGWGKVNSAMRVALDNVFLSDLIAASPMHDAKVSKQSAAADT